MQYLTTIALLTLLKNCGAVYTSYRKNQPPPQKNEGCSIHEISLYANICDNVKKNVSIIRLGIYGSINIDGFRSFLVDEMTCLFLLENFLRFFFFDWGNTRENYCRSTFISLERKKKIAFGWKIRLFCCTLWLILHWKKENKAVYWFRHKIMTKRFSFYNVRFEILPTKQARLFLTKLLMYRIINIKQLFRISIHN